MAQILSNGSLKKGDHLAAVNSSCSRVSIVTFYYPNPLSVVRPLDGLIDNENPTALSKTCLRKRYCETMLRGPN